MAKTKAPSGGRRLADAGLFGLAMRLRDDNHRSGLARTRRQWALRLWSGTRRRRTGDDRRVVVMMMVMMMAAYGGEGQGADNQQGEEFTHGHVSFCCGGNDNGWIRFCVFSLSLPTNITGERDFLIYFIKKIIIERKTGQMGQMG